MHFLANQKLENRYALVRIGDGDDSPVQLVEIPTVKPQRDQDSQSPLDQFVEQFPMFKERSVASNVVQSIGDVMVGRVTGQVASQEELEAMGIRVLLNDGREGVIVSRKAAMPGEQSDTQRINFTELVRDIDLLAQGRIEPADILWPDSFYLFDERALSSEVNVTNTTSFHAKPPPNSNFEEGFITSDLSVAEHRTKYASKGTSTNFLYKDHVTGQFECGFHAGRWTLLGGDTMSIPRAYAFTVTHPDQLTGHELQDSKNRIPASELATVLQAGDHAP